MKKVMWKGFLSVLLMCIMLCAKSNILEVSAATAADQFEYSVLSDGTIRIDRYIGHELASFATDIEVPSTIEGKNVTRIGDNAFDGRSGLERIVIPSGVTYIGNSAFRECNRAATISIPDTVHT